MKKSRKLLTRFSLRSVMIAMVPIGLSLGWIGNHYRDHLTEQQFITDILSKTNASLPSTTCTIEANGKRVVFNGLPFYG